MEEIKHLSWGKRPLSLIHIHIYYPFIQTGQLLAWNWLPPDEISGL
jgi:hypothetical protein